MLSRGIAGVIVGGMAASPAEIGTTGGFRLQFTALGARIAWVYFAIWLLVTLVTLLPAAWAPMLSTRLSMLLALHPPRGALLGGGDSGFHLWQLMTGPLIHLPSAFGTLVWSTLALGFFGSTVERFLGRRRFFEVWGVATLGSLLGVGFLALVGAPQTLQFGFSPVAFALIVLACEMTPNAFATFLLVFPVRLRWVTYGVFAFVVAKTLRMFSPFGLGGGNGGYELGGMIAALLWLRYRDQLDPRTLNRRRKARRLLRAVQDNLREEPRGPIYH